MSSLIVQDVEYEKESVDALIINATKVLRSTGNIGIVAMKKEILDSLEFSPSLIHSLDLKGEQMYQRKTGLPQALVPAQTILALREATRELLEEGVAARRSAIETKIGRVKEWAMQRGLQLTAKPEYMGNYSVSLYLPVGWDYKRFVTQLRELGYFVIYGHEGPEGGTFTVCTAGHLSMEDIDGFTNAADEVLFKQSTSQNKLASVHEGAQLLPHPHAPKSPQPQ
ncbi:hypothetical protein HY285_05535 [Candidatus Peregrinibacteria bacterium]|nr:hypothetical protein [Candidatus Peregrinibacteria bacterium]MBI3816970.1 hypothetical protein [Candidatus Peregrinibacteria bacterium]